MGTYFADDAMFASPLKLSASEDEKPYLPSYLLPISMRNTCFYIYVQRVLTDINIGNYPIAPAGSEHLRHAQVESMIQFGVPFEISRLLILRDSLVQFQAYGF